MLEGKSDGAWKRGFGYPFSVAILSVLVVELDLAVEKAEYVIWGWTLFGCLGCCDRGGVDRVFVRPHSR